MLVLLARGPGENQSPRKRRETTRYHLGDAPLRSPPELRDLKQASDSRCSICRLVCFAPTEHGHATLLEDHDERVRIVPSINPTQTRLPLLQAEF